LGSIGWGVSYRVLGPCWAKFVWAAFGVLVWPGLASVPGPPGHPSLIDFWGPCLARSRVSARSPRSPGFDRFLGRVTRVSCRVPGLGHGVSLRLGGPGVLSGSRLPGSLRVSGFRVRSGVPAPSGSRVRACPGFRGPGGGLGGPRNQVRGLGVSWDFVSLSCRILGSEVWGPLESRGFWVSSRVRGIGFVSVPRAAPGVLGRVWGPRSSRFLSRVIGVSQSVRGVPGPSRRTWRGDLGSGSFFHG